MAQTFNPAAVIETALADVQATKASWTEADLAGAINDALPDYLGGLDADGRGRADRRADQAGHRRSTPCALTPDGPGSRVAARRAAPGQRRHGLPAPR